MFLLRSSNLIPIHYEKNSPQTGLGNAKEILKERNSVRIWHCRDLIPEQQLITTILYVVDIQICFEKEKKSVIRHWKWVSWRMSDMIQKPIILKHTEYQSSTRCSRWGCALHGHQKSSTLAGSLEPASSEIFRLVCSSKSKRTKRSSEICSYCTWALSRWTAAELPDKQIVWLYTCLNKENDLSSKF